MPETKQRHALSRNLQASQASFFESAFGWSFLAIDTCGSRELAISGGARIRWGQKYH